MNRWLMLLALVGLSLSAAAQDPLRVAPQAYQQEFENEWVRVQRVHYGPREKIAEHDHPANPSAYVYLNDSGPVVFKHINLPYADVTRKETKAGSFRLYKGLKEVHAVESLSNTPSDFLRVEFKTEVLDDKTLRGKFYREAHPVGENFRKPQFEDAQVRITRLVIAPRRQMEIAANAIEPVLLLALVPAQLKARGAKSKAAAVTLAAGKTRWLSVGEAQQWENAGDAEAELLQFEFKTKPTTAPAQPHEHKHE